MFKGNGNDALKPVKMELNLNSTLLVSDNFTIKKVRKYLYT